MSIPAFLDDPSIIARGREVMHARWSAYVDAAGALAGTASPFVLSLDGTWAFHYAPRPAAAPVGFEKTDFVERGWTSIPVPSNWEMHGHGEPFYNNIAYPFPACPPAAPVENPTGSYRRWFDLPEHFAERRVFLELGSADSSCQVWVNGVEVGYSTDSKLPAAFEITAHLCPGRNLVAVRVYRWPTSAYLEKQDYWHLSGLQRSVRLVAKPMVHVRDWSTRTQLCAGSATLRVRAWISPKRMQAERLVCGSVAWPECRDYRLRFRLFDQAQHELATAVAQVGELSAMYVTGEHAKDSFSGYAELTIANPQVWSPEIPHLHTLVIELLGADDAILDTEQQRIGLREVAIRNGIFELNGRRLVVRGVNRHEFNPERGRAVTDADMRADLVAMKRLNFNAVRTCHYPDCERWYELCDELGMAVVDEANLETHGLQAQLSRDPVWATAYLERLTRMILRDRNHACVVTWSLGNESGVGPHHAAMAGWARYADPSRPVQYESGFPGPLVSDIMAPMYPGLNWVRKLMTDRNEQRPMIMCEYAYAKGNSTGNVDEYWALVWELPRFQGGFVWDWSDKSIAVRQVDGSVRHIYGKPGSEVDGTERMCLNGVVGPDLEVHPGAYELKHHQSPVGLVVENIAAGSAASRRVTMRCHNRHHTLGLDHLELAWRCHDDGLTIASGTLALPEIAPYASGTLTVELPAGDPPTGMRRLLDLSVRHRVATGWCPAGHEVVAAQAVLTAAVPAAGLGHDPSAVVELKLTTDRATVRGVDWEVAFAAQTGSLASLVAAGRELIARPFGLCLHRAPTDIDLLGDHNGYAETWKQAGLDQPVVVTGVLTAAALAPDQVKVRWVGTLSGPGARIERTSTWTIHGSGDLVLDERVVVTAALVPTLARIGLEGSLSGGCDHWRWLGRGPFENYPDRKHAALIGDHRQSVADNLTPYIFPQECGLRCDINWLALTAADGAGLFVQGLPRLHASALPVRREDLIAAENRADLIRRDEVAVHLDGFHMGLGGDTGWTRNVHAPYLLPPGDYRWSVRLRALRAGEDPALLGRSG